jgi:hypothetical protein
VIAALNAMIKKSIKPIQQAFLEVWRWITSSYWKRSCTCNEPCHCKYYWMKTRPGVLQFLAFCSYSFVIPSSHVASGLRRLSLTLALIYLHIVRRWYGNVLHPLFDRTHTFPLWYPPKNEEADCRTRRLNEHTPYTSHGGIS